MPNKNYDRGAEYERRLVRKYKAMGYTAMRSAGSHGVFDVVAVKPPHWVRAAVDNGVNGKFNQNLEDGEIVLIQAKTGKSAEREKAKLEGLKAKYGGIYSVRVELL